MTYYARYKERACPFCGVIERRPPQTLCSDCQWALEMGLKRRREIEAFAATGEKVRVAIGTQFHYGTGAQLSFLHTTDKDMLRALVFLGKLESCRGTESEHGEVRAIHHKQIGHRPLRPAQFVWATSEQADAIQVILDYIKEAVTRAYEEGHAEGRSLIKVLATVGTDEINRMVMGAG